MVAHNAIDWAGKEVNQLRVLRPDRRRQGYWLCICSCGRQCSVNSMSLKGGQKSCGCARRKSSANRIDRAGRRYGKLTVLMIDPAASKQSLRWICRCDCGNEVSVLSTNLVHMEKNEGGCRHCSHRQDITGERIGLLTAEESEAEVVTGREPLWTFRCDCGNSIQGTVREFHSQGLRSCGCHDNAYGSWASMMARCYESGNNRYNSYGGRGIRVCKRWHEFKNFIADMGERPKRHNLGRRHAEKDYSPSNCFWEHVSKNCRDTKNDGTPTNPGRRKGAKPR